MMPSSKTLWSLLAAPLAVAACHGKADEPAPPPTVVAGNAAASAEPVPSAGSQFDPLLRSEALKDAIHRALTTGENQRWQDGELSGYAVPSREPLPNGCRTIRYTVDQRPNAPMTTINACEGSR